MLILAAELFKLNTFLIKCLEDNFCHCDAYFCMIQGAFTFTLNERRNIDGGYIGKICVLSRMSVFIIILFFLLVFC